MASSLPEWLEGQAERIAARQRSRADNAKLVATFAAGISGGLVASALQTGTLASAWDKRASILLGLTFLATALVILLDRQDEADHQAVLQDSVTATPRWTEDQTLFELRRALLAAVRKNEQVIRWVGRTMWLQLLLAVFTSSAAVYSMLRT